MSNPNRVFIIPKEGVLVRSPNLPRNLLKKEGEYKSMVGDEGKYWKRREADGSVTILAEAPTNKSKKG